MGFNMVFEFDYEVALLQSAFRDMQNWFGDDLTNLEYLDVINGLQVFQYAISDMEHIRIADKVSSAEIQHRDRKLVVGLFYNVLRSSLELTPSSNECFEALEDVYPPFGWTVFLGVVSIGRWHDHLFECLDAIHPALFCDIIQEVLPYVSDTNYTGNVSFVVRVLALLMCPEKREQVMKLSAKRLTAAGGRVVVLPDYEDLLKTVYSVVVQQLVSHSSWTEAVINDFLLVLLRRLQTTFRYLMGDPSCQSELKCSLTEMLKQLTVDSISSIYGSAVISEQKTEVHLNDNNKTLTVHIIMRFVALCFESLTTINWKPMLENIQSKLKLKLLSSSLGSQKLTELQVALVELNFLFKIMETVDFGKSDEALQLLNLIRFAHQYINEYCQSANEFGMLLSKEGITAAIDARIVNSAAYIEHVICHPEFLSIDEWLDCLIRNASLIKKEQGTFLVNVIEDGIRDPTARRKTQQIVLAAFSSWPCVFQQQFQLEFLLNYKEHQDILALPNFHQEMTATFNKLVQADIDEVDTTLKTQIACLCLQSARSTLLKTVQLAISSTSQMTLILEVLPFLSSAYRFQDVPNSLPLLSEILKEVVESYCQTDAQLQNFEAFVALLLKESLLTIPEIVCSCVLPFLDKWNPGQDCKKLVLALRLLHMTVSLESCNEGCLRYFQPCALLVYLGIITFQCKLMSKGPDLNWIQVKTVTTVIIERLLHILLQEHNVLNRKDVLWLKCKLKKVDEKTVFYFLDLFEFYDVDTEFEESTAPLEVLLELACTSNRHAKIASVWFAQVVKRLKTDVSTQLVAAMSKVLPSCTEKEWARLIPLLDGSIDFGMVVAVSDITGTVLSPAARCIVGEAALIGQVFDMCVASGTNVLHMLRCFNLAVKERMNYFEANCKKNDELPHLAAKVCIEVCFILCKLPPEFTQEGSVLLMELGRMCLKNKVASRKIAANVLFASIKTLPESEFQNNLLDSYKSMLMSTAVV